MTKKKQRKKGNSSFKSICVCLIQNALTFTEISSLKLYTVQNSHDNKKSII